MAAVFALILIPVIAASGFMLLSNLGSGPVAVLATLCFGLLAYGVFGGLFRMARRWEDEVLD